MKKVFISALLLALVLTCGCASSAPDAEPEPTAVTVTLTVVFETSETAVKTTLSPVVRLRWPTPSTSSAHL